MRTPHQEAVSKGMKAWLKRRKRAQAAYDWRQDATGSYAYAMHMKALAVGARRFKTIPEMYWQEQHGLIP